MREYRFVELPLPRAGLEAETIVVSGTPQEEVLSLFDRHSVRLRRYILSFGLRAEATEDVLQDVFLLVFRHLLLGRSRQNLRGWIFKVGHDLALKHRTRTGRTERTERAWDTELISRRRRVTFRLRHRWADGKRSSFSSRWS